MRIGNNRIFPYPIMGENNNATAIKGAIYELNCEIIQNAKELSINNVSINFNNSYLDYLMQSDVITAYLLVECPKTIFREKYTISKESQNISIEINHLNDKVEITSFIVANQDFTYSCDDFIDDYKGYTFNIEKGCILAVNTGFDVRVDYSGINDNNVSSIFLITSDSEEAEDMRVVLDDRSKIKIFLPKKQYDIYYRLKFNDRLKNMFYSIIGIPALVKALQEIYTKAKREEFDDIEDIEYTYFWFKTIENAYANQYNKKLNLETFMECDVVELSQCLLGHANSKAIEDIVDLYDVENKGDDDDE